MRYGRIKSELAAVARSVECHVTWLCVLIGRKFICLNDNIDHTKEGAHLVSLSLTLDADHTLTHSPHHPPTHITPHTHTPPHTHHSPHCHRLS